MGYAKTYGICAGDGHANVEGFMATNRSRDPIGFSNRKNDDFGSALNAQVDFKLLMVHGGAKNLANRTILEANHLFACGIDRDFDQSFTEWPRYNVAMVIDDTGSMGDQLEGVKQGLSAMVNAPDQQGTTFGLVTFKDTPKTVIAGTDDKNTVLSALQNLVPDGGDDCPEDALGGVQTALDNMAGDANNHLGQIFLATDASSQSADLNGIIHYAQDLGVKVNVMLSGICTEDRAMKSADRLMKNERITSAEGYQRLARETGGVYRYISHATPEQYAQVARDMLETSSGIVTLSPNAPLIGASGGEGFRNVYKFTVEEGTTHLQIATSHGTGQIHAYLSHESIPAPGRFAYSAKEPGTRQTITVDRPKAGVWFLMLQGITPFDGVDILYTADRSAIPPGSANGFQVTVSKDADWGAGYCTNYRVVNKNPVDAEWHIPVSIDGKIDHSWNAVFSSDTGISRVSGASYNRILKPNAMTQFGFCATRYVSIVIYIERGYGIFL